MEANAAVVVEPDGSTREIAAAQIGAGRWRAEFPVTAAGSYLVSFSAGKGEDGRDASVQGSVSVPYPKEFRTVRDNRALLEQIAEKTGGRVLRLGNPVGVDAFLREDPRRPLPPGEVLVPGCGRGHEAALLAELGFEAIGLDLSGEALQEARRLHGADRPGLRWLQASASGAVFSRYHAEAAIAAEHALAPSFAETRWDEIAGLYTLLDRTAPSPLNALNRAVALAEAHGAQAGLNSLEGVRLPPGLAGYYLWDAVVGDLLRRAGNTAQARVCLSRALAGAPTEAERALLRRRLASLPDDDPPR